ncbi:MAG: rane protein [Mycobacterium sp.]|jgi:uncharacterized membrane protein (TIGR02234 family)|nr:rane protein [Mycobacterium sp.]
MIRLAQLLLVIAALGLWVASRLPWVEVTSFDGLGQPKTVTLNGATWSTALLPLALLLLAAAVAVLAVRGWSLRALAILVAAVSGLTAYLAITQWVVRDVSIRGADLAEVTVASLVGSQRFHWGAVLTLVAAVLSLVAGVLLLRCAGAGKATTTKYVAPAARRAAARDSADEQLPDNRRTDAADSDASMSERMIWDALDEGRDPTAGGGDSAAASDPGPDREGR